MNRKEFAERMKRATPAERLEIMGRYIQWINQGTRAQGWYSLGLLPLGACAFIAFALALRGPHNVVAYAVCAVCAFAGAWLTAIAFRRERDWRRAHPFQIRGDDAQVR